MAIVGAVEGLSVGRGFVIAGVGGDGVCVDCGEAVVGLVREVVACGAGVQAARSIARGSKPR
jgi:hypothetical protein